MKEEKEMLLMTDIHKSEQAQKVKEKKPEIS